uniref:Uncharacterized protein n=1 Tax=Caenorhabditis japonica TaxID=281687 RepID=A0A8R1IFU6_CAEJA
MPRLELNRSSLGPNVLPAAPSCRDGHSFFVPLIKKVFFLQNVQLLLFFFIFLYKSKLIPLCHSPSLTHPRTLFALLFAFFFTPQRQ